MALAGGTGVELDPVIEIDGAAGWFGEDQGRYVVTASDPTNSDFVDLAERAGVHYALLGRVGGRCIRGVGPEVPLADLRRAHEQFFPGLMGGSLAVA
jgi:phosphoribosylformylglycinamidine synthase